MHRTANRTRLGLLVGLLVLSAVSLCVSHFWQRFFSVKDPAAKASSESQRAPRVERHPAIRVSETTTYVLGPLDATGYVDFHAALDQRAREGVTAENNYEVVVGRLLGPGELPEAYFKQLNMPMPPRQGRYLREFVQFHANSATQRELEEEYELLKTSPWSVEAHPKGAKWLEAMNPLLDELVEGTRRPRRYVPLAEGTDRTLVMNSTTWMSSVQQQRFLAYALIVRANSRLHAGNLDGAWGDIQAIHRQARLACEGLSMIETLVGFSLESLASTAEIALLRSGRLTADQTRRFLADLQQLPEFPSVISKLRFGDRLQTLDAVQCLARNGKGVDDLLDELFGGSKLNLEQMLQGDIDWNVAMNVVNAHYDAIVDAYSEVDFIKANSKQSNYQKQLADLFAHYKDDPAARVRLMLLGTPRARGRKMGEFLIVLMTPASDQALQAQRQVASKSIVARVGLALELFRFENGSYPQALKALEPGIVPSVPLDPFTGKTLAYVPGGRTGFIVYGVGKNCRDDRGVFSLPDSDDLAAEGPPASK